MAQSNALDFFGRGSAVRRERRAVAKELADYATVAERDDLAALLDARGFAGSLAADILSGQSHRELFRTS